jgi:DNA helicase-4
LSGSGQESPFVVELVQEGKVPVDDDGASDIVVCPACTQGTLVIRSGPYGTFRGCSSFPRCRFTQKVVTQTRPAPAS